MKITFKALWIVLLSITVNVLLIGQVLAFIATDYPLSTMEQRYKCEDGIEHTIICNGGNYVYLEPITFSINSKYLNQSRKISAEKALLIELYAQNRRLSLDSIYKHEILIKDVDSNEYWIPIQETHLTSLKDEWFSGAKITLYLLMLGKIHDSCIVVTNEFKVDEVDTSYLFNGPCCGDSALFTVYDVPTNKDVYNIIDGRVSRLSKNPFNKTNFGSFVEVQHHQQIIKGVGKDIIYYSIYGCLSEILVDTNENVIKGRIIAKTGQMPNHNYKNKFNGNLVFGLYSYTLEPYLEELTMSKAIYKSGVYWYDPKVVFNKNRRKSNSRLIAPSIKIP